MSNYEIPFDNYKTICAEIKQLSGTQLNMAIMTEILNYKHINALEASECFYTSYIGAQTVLDYVKNSMKIITFNSYVVMEYACKFLRDTAKVDLDNGVEDGFAWMLYRLSGFVLAQALLVGYRCFLLWMDA